MRAELLQLYFCNPRCREKFLADPVRFLAA
jgi:YHS domain-containing protein